MTDHTMKAFDTDLQDLARMVEVEVNTGVIATVKTMVVEDK